MILGAGEGDWHGGSSVLKSLSRGVQVLQCFTPDTPSLALTAIAAEIGVPKGSAFRLVSTLEQLGDLRQDPLGVKVLTLGQACLSGMVWPDVALPHLEELAKATRESASMAILDETEIVYVARASIRRVMSSNLFVGSRLPAYCTSLGKVLLAHLEPDELASLLAVVVFEPYTHLTVADADDLCASLATIRQQGYAISDRELDLTLRSIAAPVRDASGTVVAAINVSTFASRVPVNELEEHIIPRLLETANTISNALGFRPGARVGDVHMNPKRGNP